MSSEIETLMKYLSLGPDDEGVGISYMSEISSGGNKNSSKILKWPAVLLQNCDDEGRLLDLSSTNSVFKSQKNPWLLQLLSYYADYQTLLCICAYFSFKLLRLFYLRLRRKSS